MESIFRAFLTVLLGKRYNVSPVFKVPEISDRRCSSVAHPMLTKKNELNNA